MLLVNLLRYIRQFTSEADKRVNYFCWQEEDIVEASWPDNQDVELPAMQGSNCVDHLCDWAKVNSEVTMLLLTDGYFKLNTNQRNLLSQLDNLYLIGIGGDVDLNQLTTVFKYSFHASGLDNALQTIFRPKVVNTAPLNRVELVKVNINNGMEEDDEW